MSKLVIVESPTKAKTISKFLKKGFEVTSSYGHIRDLPNSAAEIPASVKKEAWSRLGINVDDNFTPLYVIPADKKKRIKELKDLLKDADEIYLATDEDREGESISWHLLEVLNPKIPVKRMVFHEITSEAILEALNNPREIDFNLVKAQETRRIVDRLYGYSVSPLLWKKMAPRLSAGRVQSVAMKLLVERERERIAFVSATYSDLTASLKVKEVADSKFDAKISSYDGKKVAESKDFDANTGKLDNQDVYLINAEEASKLKQLLLSSAASVTKIESKPYTTRPYPPFVTSTLQQEGNRKLRQSAKRTMQVAQNLYENGFITYMRTDSTTLSEEALQGARDVILSEFGKEYLNDGPRKYQTKVKNAQEAHEAIRPAGAKFAHPKDVRAALGDEAGNLYELIWKRTLASQMPDARGQRQSAEITIEKALFKASGKTIEFAGYLRAYVEGSDDPEAELADQEKVLPELKLGQSLQIVDISADEHNTQAPPRFTEGSLIKELERLGIGRPSTWATVVDLVLSRDYAFKKGTALVPTFLAHALTGLMERYFTHLVDYNFTAKLEDDLDAISRGEAESLNYLKTFYFGNGHPGLKTLVEDGQEKIDPRDVCGVPIIPPADGKKLEVRIGRYGPFLTNGEANASIPEGLAPDEMTIEKANEILATAAKGPESLGLDPISGLPVFLKTGRFGPYVQLGEKTDDFKPKMASLLRGQKPDEVNLELALKLLSLPRIVGINPTNSENIVAANGRFGPYIKCGDETRSLGALFSPIEVTLDECVTLLSTPKQGRGRSFKPAVLKELGENPQSKAKIAIKTGRYGPYVTDGETNASLPKGSNPDTITIEEALRLISERAAMPKKEKKGRAKKSKKTKAQAEE